MRKWNYVVDLWFFLFISHPKKNRTEPKDRKYTILHSGYVWILFCCSSFNIMMRYQRKKKLDTVFIYYMRSAAPVPYLMAFSQTKHISPLLSVYPLPLSLHNFHTHYNQRNWKMKYHFVNLLNVAKQVATKHWMSAVCVTECRCVFRLLILFYIDIY